MGEIRACTDRGAGAREDTLPGHTKSGWSGAMDYLAELHELDWCWFVPDEAASPRRRKSLHH